MVIHTDLGSTIMAQKSLTLVRVEPVTIRFSRAGGESAATGKLLGQGARGKAKKRVKKNRHQESHKTGEVPDTGEKSQVTINSSGRRNPCLPW
jgi:hypothetical protein